MLHSFLKKYLQALTHHNTTESIYENTEATYKGLQYCNSIDYIATWAYSHNYQKEGGLVFLTFVVEFSSLSFLLVMKYSECSVTDYVHSVDSVLSLPPIAFCN